MAERHITLVRHGQYTRTDEVGGGDLTDIGIKQAGHAGRALEEQYPITALYSSTLRRAITTAHIIANQQPDVRGFVQQDILCEAVFHVPENSKTLQAQFADISPEMITAQRIRVAHAYDTFVKPALGEADEHDVIVTHGNVIRYFVMRVMNAPIELWANIDVYHTGLTRLLVYPSGHAKLITHNEIAHLPRHLWTY